MEKSRGPAIPKMGNWFDLVRQISALAHSQCDDPQEARLDACDETSVNISLILGDCVRH